MSHNVGQLAHAHTNTKTSTGLGNLHSSCPCSFSIQFQIFLATGSHRAGPSPDHGPGPLVLPLGNTCAHPPECQMQILFMNMISGNKQWSGVRTKHPHTLIHKHIIKRKPPKKNKEKIIFSLTNSYKW